MENDKVRSFADLRAWQEGHKLALLTYQYTKSFPKEEIFALVSQMRRATISVTSNIAEGFSRHTAKDKLSFYAIALGSLTELESQSMLAKDLGYITKKETNTFLEQSQFTQKLIMGLRKSAQNRSV